MKTKEEIKKEIAKLQQELDNYDTYKRPFIPSEGDTFYWVNATGGIIQEVYENSEFQAGLIQNRPVFRTREAAEPHAKVNQATLAVERRIAELNDGWWPDFGDSNQEKWAIGWNSYSYALVWSTHTWQENLPQRYLKSEKLNKQLIEEMPEELKLMITGERL